MLLPPVMSTHLLGELDAILTATEKQQGHLSTLGQTDIVQIIKTYKRLTLALQNLKIQGKCMLYYWMIYEKFIE